MKYDARSEVTENKYNPIRKTSPISYSKDRSTKDGYYDNSKLSSGAFQPTASTKPLVLRKRNRDPYNPYPDPKSYLEYGGK